MWSRMRRIAVQVGDLYMKPCRQTERGMRDKVSCWSCVGKEEEWRCGQTGGWSHADRSRRTGEEVRDLCPEMFQQAGGGICNQLSRGTSGCCCVKKDEAGWR